MESHVTDIARVIQLVVAPVFLLGGDWRKARHPVTACKVPGAAPPRLYALHAGADG